MGVPLNSIVPAAVRTGFAQLEQIVKVVIIERKRGDTNNKPEPSTATPQFDPVTGLATTARNRFDSNTRKVTQEENTNVFTTLADIPSVPTRPSPTALANSPAGIARFAVNALLLSPKVKLADALMNTRVGDLNALFEVRRLPMLDGQRLIPDAKDKIRIGDIVYTIQSAKSDPTDSLITASLMRGSLGGDFTDGQI